MEAKVTTEYQIIQNQTHTIVLDLDFAAYALKYNLEITSRLDLETELENYINEFYASFTAPGHEDIVDTYNQAIDILNIDEIVEHYSYLIKIPACCYEAPEGAKYCPTCGTII